MKPDCLVLGYVLFEAEILRVLTNSHQAGDAGDAADPLWESLKGWAVYVV